MKMNFAYNLLKNLRSKKDDGGFTLIELLVVIIIIGILAAIALPSFLNQANRARETEATNGVGALNRGQQAFYLEEVIYAPAMASLDVGVDPVTGNFVFGSATAAPTVDGTTGEITNTVAAADATTGGGTGAGYFNRYDSNQLATIYASPKEGIRGFGGVAYVAVSNDKNVTGAVLCRESAAQAKTAGVGAAVIAAAAGDTPTDVELCGGATGLEPVN